MPDLLFSIVIASYRRHVELAACLRSLSQQDAAPELYEVIVVDDAGDLSADCLAPLGKRISAMLLQPGHAGPSGARNAGVAHARGAWLWFIDDDCELARDSLSRLQALTARYPEATIAGAFADANPGNLWSAASQAQLEAIAAYYNRDPEHATFGGSGNLALPAAGFRALGGFSEHLRTAEDRDLLDRWLCQGRQLVYAPEVLATHRHPVTWRDYWRRNRGYGAGARLFAQQRRTKGQSAPPVDLASYRHLLTWPFKTRMPRRVRVAVALLLARLAYFRGYLGTASSAEAPPC
jgi:glycosyltransferase involved in cell wall biosynthesis